MSKTYRSGIMPNTFRNPISRKKTKRVSKRAFKDRETGDGSNYKRFYDSYFIHDGFYADDKYKNKVKKKNKWIVK